MVKPLKAQFYKFISRLLEAPTVREQLYRSARDLFSQPRHAGLSGIQSHAVPQAYCRQTGIEESPARPAPVFITARFRSGSTFLWQLFRKIEGITCYYEPLNERRWFLEQPGSQVDNTHLGVEDYRQEYQGMQDLERVFDLNWPFRYLYMDATHHDPNLKKYIDALIERAERRAVLQFNRVDFRLPWLKANYPEAKIVHLYRDPREQWMSFVGKGGSIGLDASYQPGQLSGHNDFYTLEWARDLRHVFPFLEPYGRHPYAVHYLLWRLSYSFGKSFGDISIGYEELVTNFKEVMNALINKLAIQNASIEELEKLNQGKLKSRWREYAPEEWFAEIEAACDREIEIFYSAIKGKSE